MAVKAGIHGLRTSFSCSCLCACSVCCGLRQATPIQHASLAHSSLMFASRRHRSPTGSHRPAHCKPPRHRRPVCEISISRCTEPSAVLHVRRASGDARTSRTPGDVRSRRQQQRESRVVMSPRHRRRLSLAAATRYAVSWRAVCGMDSSVLPSSDPPPSGAWPAAIAVNHPMHRRLRPLAEQS